MARKRRSYYSRKVAGYLCKCRYRCIKRVPNGECAVCGRQSLEMYVSLTHGYNICINCIRDVMNLIVVHYGKEFTDLPSIDFFGRQPSEPTICLPGTPGKIAVMRKRVLQFESPCHEEDERHAP